MNAKISDEVNKNYTSNLSENDLIEKYFYYKDNLWNEFKGIKWFNEKILSENEKINLIDEFKSLEILKSKNDFELIDLTLKAKEKFKNDLFVNKIFIFEPYTYNNLWKTHFWYMMHDAKWNSDIKTIKFFAEILYNKYLELQKIYDFKYLAIIPPTLKGRKIQIMDFIKDYFLIKDDNLQFIELLKVDWTPSQKSLKKFEDRKQNAINSIILNTKNKQLWSILIIDDAIWSWTTMNYVAKNIKQNNSTDNIIWLWIIWSMRWFDIIREI